MHCGNGPFEGVIIERIKKDPPNETYCARYNLPTGGTFNIRWEQGLGWRVLRNGSNFANQYYNFLRFESGYPIAVGEWQHGFPNTQPADMFNTFGTSGQIWQFTDSTCAAPCSETWQNVSSAFQSTTPSGQPWQFGGTIPSNFYINW